MFFLVIAVILFIIILIPLFQNAALASIVHFYGSHTSTFTSVYMPLVFMSMLE